MSTSIDKIFNQLTSNSPKAVKDAFKCLSRQTDIPDNLIIEAANIIGGLDQLSDEIVKFIVRHPNMQLYNVYCSLFQSENIPWKILAVQSSGFWSRSLSVSVAKTLIEKLVGLLQLENENSWIVFLAAINLNRSFGSDETNWYFAAKAVIQADKLEWWQSIRTQAEEILSREELIEINKRLVELNAGVLLY